MSFEQETVEEEKPGASQADLVASYLAFGRRAVRERRLLAGLIFVGVSALTIAIVSLLPRTYHCEMKLMTERTDMLSRNAQGEGFRGASEIIMRHENLEAVVRQTELAKTWGASRPPLLKFKDNLIGALRGPTSEADLESMLVATLESKLSVNASDNSNTMSIGIDWHEPQAAAQLVEATHQRFLEVRHSADVSTIAEYISILEGHATELRQEIDTVAEQVQKLAAEKAKAGERVAPAPGDAGAPVAVTAPVARRPSQPRARLQPDEDLPRLKTTLELKQSTLKQLQEDRKRRVIDLQAKLTEAKARYTPAHPAVVDLERQLAAMSEDTPEVTALKATVDELEAEIKERTSDYVSGAAPRSAGMGAPSTAAILSAPGTPGAAAADAQRAGPLPTDVMALVQTSAESVDPAIAAQFRYVVSKYTTVRDQISTARIELDTAQAAFRHRYKVVTPADVPNRSVKPKVPALIAGGMVGGLLLALLVPVLLELRRRRFVEKWQVVQMHLPVLAELRFPPGPPSPP
jgi:uncharacterized protein involved in exopolysaccharide biosynthesis